MFRQGGECDQTAKRSGEDAESGIVLGVGDRHQVVGEPFDRQALPALRSLRGRRVNCDRDGRTGRSGTGPVRARPADRRVRSCRRCHSRSRAADRDPRSVLAAGCRRRRPSKAPFGAKRFDDLRPAQRSRARLRGRHPGGLSSTARPVGGNVAGEVSLHGHRRPCSIRGRGQEREKPLIHRNSIGVDGKAPLRGVPSPRGEPTRASLLRESTHDHPR